ncbi:MAG: SpoIIE family protein phosphatase [Planctomycetota bacterium]
MQLTKDIAGIADRLLAADTAQQLIAILDEEIGRLDCGPGVLYLFDAVGKVYYPAAGLACEVTGADIALGAEPPDAFRLGACGQPIGLLVLAPGAENDRRVTMLAAMLGPLLVQLHRRQVVVEELRETREIVSQVALAGDLLRHLDLQVLLTKLLETALNATGAQVGAVLLPDAQGKLEVQVTWGLNAEHLALMRLRDGRQLVEAVFATGDPVVASRAEINRTLDISALDAQLDGILVLALGARERILGVLVLANPTQDFGPAKRRLAETLCNLAGTAIDNALLVKDAIERERLRQEIDIARTVQEKMFPLVGITVADLVVEGWSHPCSETGGDYYAFIPRGNGLVAMIGDVSGHGLGAALFTTMAHALTQQQFRAGADMMTAFRQINEGLFHTRSGRFMTAAAVAVDATTGQFDYVSAGHTPTLWIHNGVPQWLESTSMPLGIMPDLKIDTDSQRILAPGDILVLYTDGITEATHNDETCLGEERLADTVMAAWRSNLPPRKVLELIAATVNSFTAGRAQSDDLTAVVVARLATGEVGGWQVAAST